MLQQRIMIVDAEEDLRALFALILEHHGYEVVQARNGRHALEQLMSSALPELILLDASTRPVDAELFCAVWSGDPLLQRIPLVLLGDEPEIAERARELGATAGVVKPHELEEVVALAGRAARRVRQRDAVTVAEAG